MNLYNPHFARDAQSATRACSSCSRTSCSTRGTASGSRRAPLLDFDYTREAYTPCLWVMEGITSHYDRFALRSSGRITAKSFLDKVLDDWARLQATPGRARQSLEQ